jgi:pimeloyl-[acyl-carrier protein] methyl ester esterase
MTLYTQSSGSGPELVLIHGWGLHGGVWETLVPLLEPAFRVTCVDLPGHGRSAWRNTDGLEGMAQAVLESAPARAAWVGWSLGGLVAAQAALTAPARIERLVLLAATPSFVRRPDWPLAMAPELLEAFADDLRRDYRHTLQRFLALQVHGSEQAQIVLRGLRARLLQRDPPAPQALAAGLEILRTADLRARLADIACPVLFLMGARDTLVPAAAARQALDHMPNARVEIVAGAGHAPFLVAPGAVAAVIGDFLQSAKTPATGESYGG